MEQANDDEKIEHVRPIEAVHPEIKQDHALGEALAHQLAQSKSHRPVFQQRLKAIVESSNFWIALFTGLLLVVAYFQLIASQEATKAAVEAKKTNEESLRVSQASYRISEQTMKLAERAWVVVMDAGVVGPIEVGKYPKTKIAIKNSGKSPAWKTKVRHYISILAASNLPDVPMPDIKTIDTESLTVLGPGDVVHSEVAFGAPLTQEQVAHLKRKEWRIITYGAITYFDNFEEKHETKFCLIWRDFSTMLLSSCDKWNDAN